MGVAGDESCTEAGDESVSKVGGRWASWSCFGATDVTLDSLDSSLLALRISSVNAASVVYPGVLIAVLAFDLADTLDPSSFTLDALLNQEFRELGLTSDSTSSVTLDIRLGVALRC